MRINGFEQMKAFYSWVFENQEKNIRTTHISLYMFLLNQNNRNNWVEWFKCPFDLAMAGSGITNKKTYYNTLLELQDYNLIKYKKGVNNYKAPLIKIEVLFDTSTVPQSEPQLQPQVIPLPEPLLLPQMLPNIKLLTNNLKLITVNVERILDFLKNDTAIIELEKPSSDVLYNFETLKTFYLKDKQIVKAVASNKKNLITEEEIPIRINEFNTHLIENGEPLKTFKDYCSHFKSWHIKNKKSKIQINNVKRRFT